jgi:hypothetical protein
LIVAALAAVAVAVPASAGAKQHTRVMTRNLYLGADLGPALGAPNYNAFIDANGQVLRDVDTNNFPVRARGLAKEILNRSPQLVGLQEVALWRTGPLNDFAPFTGPTATDVKYDYLQLLLDQLNKDDQRYKEVFTEPEFDFEAPTDYNGVPGDGDGGLGNADGEINGRLTMRDVILARTGAGVKIQNATGGHYSTLFTPVVAGALPVPITRGWTQADVTLRDSEEFRFVNTHLEAFGDPHIRQAQAQQLVGPGGPADPSGSLPVILLGDLNSDDDTVSGDDRLAYQAITDAGFSERSTADPLSCCLNTSILIDNFGSVSDFDHQVDHVLTDDPDIPLTSSLVSGRKPVNGYWDSDHAGLFSDLQVPRP